MKVAKVAWVSNSPWASTGYGQQTALMLPRLLRRYGPNSTACLSLYGLHGGPLKLDGVQHYPASSTHEFSDDILAVHAQHWLGDEPGITFILWDVWAFQNPQWAELPMLAAWVPIDHAPPPPPVLAFFRRTGAVPIAMSKWGRDWLDRKGLDPLYVPHAIDTNVMRRVDVLHGKPSRELFDIDADRYVVGMVAANKGISPNRKSFAESFMAFSLWLDDAKIPDGRRPLLYVHCDPTPGSMSVDLYRTAESCGLTVGEDVKFSDPYVHRIPYSADAMAALYSSFDVLLQPSRGEGFGIPAIESAACGVPVIGCGFSAQTEVIGDTGWLVECEPDYDYAQHAWFVRPVVADITRALQDCGGRSVGEVADGALRCREHALTYDVDRVWVDYWEPVLDELECRLPSREPVKVAAGWSR